MSVTFISTNPNLGNLEIPVAYSEWNHTNIVTGMIAKRARLASLGFFYKKRWSTSVGKVPMSGLRRSLNVSYYHT